MSKITMDRFSNDPRFIEELERERRLIDEVILAWNAYRDKLRQLPPESLKRIGRLVEDRTPEDAEGNFKKIRDFLALQSESPQTTGAIRKATGLLRSSISAVLYTTHKNSFKSIPDPTHGKRRLWSLKSPTQETINKIVPTADGVLKEVIQGMRDAGYDGPELRDLPAEVNKGIKEAEKADLAGKSIVECVSRVLIANHGLPMHYKEIAREAVLRGYTGKAGKTPLTKPEDMESIFNSFATTIRTHPDLFPRKGDGHYAYDWQGAQVENAARTRAGLESKSIS
jgi:hypothetical protein